MCRNANSAWAPVCDRPHHHPTTAALSWCPLARSSHVQQQHSRQLAPPAPPAQLSAASRSLAADAGVLDRLRSRSFSSVEWQVALDGQDPHVVGVATLDEDADLERSIRGAKKQQQQQGGKQQGFRR